MKDYINSLKVVQSYKVLKGNARLSVNYELAFGIPFALMNFYKTLYMKELGISDIQIGYLISIQFISGAVFALFGGAITDALGRKKTLFIFDLIAWPVSIFILLFANGFWTFALAAVANSANQIVMVAWTCFLIEDAGSEERVAAFNLTNLLMQCAGIITPIAGIIVGNYGIVTGHRIILLFGAITLGVRIILRNIHTVETKIGQEILMSRRKNQPVLDLDLYKRSLKVMLKQPQVVVAVLMIVIVDIGLVIFSFTNRSNYFVPYLTEVLKLDKLYISTIGTVSSIVMILVFAVFIPNLSGKDYKKTLVYAILLEVTAFLLLLFTREGNLMIVIICAAIYFLGFSLIRTYMDFILAEAAEGKERAGIYSLTYVMTSVVIGTLGPLIGLLYTTKPRMIVMAAVLLLVLLLFMLSRFVRLDKSSIQ